MIEVSNGGIHTDESGTWLEVVKINEIAFVLNDQSFSALNDKKNFAFFFK